MFREFFLNVVVHLNQDDFSCENLILIFHRSRKLFATLYILIIHIRYQRVPPKVPHALVPSAGSQYDDGYWIIELRHVGSMLENNGFDNICHEHLIYYSLKTLEDILQRYNLEIIDVVSNSINGGSFQVWVAHSGRMRIDAESARRINAFRQSEMDMQLASIKPYMQFKKNVFRDYLNLNSSTLKCRSNLGFQST